MARSRRTLARRREPGGYGDAAPIEPHRTQRTRAPSCSGTRESLVLRTPRRSSDLVWATLPNRNLLPDGHSILVPDAFGARTCPSIARHINVPDLSPPIRGKRPSLALSPWGAFGVRIARSRPPPIATALRLLSPHVGQRLTRIDSVPLPRPGRVGRMAYHPEVRRRTSLIVPSTLAKYSRVTLSADWPTTATIGTQPKALSTVAASRSSDLGDLAELQSLADSPVSTSSRLKYGSV